MRQRASVPSDSQPPRMQHSKSESALPPSGHRRRRRTTSTNRRPKPELRPDQQRAARRREERRAQARIERELAKLAERQAARRKQHAADVAAADTAGGGSTNTRSFMTEAPEMPSYEPSLTASLYGLSATAPSRSSGMAAGSEARIGLWPSEDAEDSVPQLMRSTLDVPSMWKQSMLVPGNFLGSYEFRTTPVAPPPQVSPPGPVRKAPFVSIFDEHAYARNALREETARRAAHVQLATDSLPPVDAGGVALKKGVAWRPHPSEAMERVTLPAHLQKAARRRRQERLRNEQQRAYREAARRHESEARRLGIGVGALVSASQPGAGARRKSSTAGSRGRKSGTRRVSGRY